MLAHGSEIRQTLSLLDFARAELDNKGIEYGPVKLGAMIEIPAAALTLKLFRSDRLALGAVLLNHIVPMFVAGSLLMTIRTAFSFGVEK